MSQFSFRLAPHSVKPDQQTVEVWDGDTFVAAIYSDDRSYGLRIVSKYLHAAVLDQRHPATVEVSLHRPGPVMAGRGP